MEYLGLTEEDMLDFIITIEEDMIEEKEKYRTKLRELGHSEPGITKRLEYFESTYLIRKLMAENNRRLVDEMREEFDVRKRDMFI